MQTMTARSSLASFTSRFWRRSTLAAPSTRLQVCPPAVWPHSQPAWRRLLKSLGSWVPVSGVSLRQLDRVGEARQEFEAALDDLHSRAADEMRLRVSRARSLRELWHLRAPLFDVVARARSQSVAEQRLQALNRHFPTRAPRSGFAPLEAS